MLFKKLRALAKKIKAEVAVYRLVWKDPRTPRIAKAFLGLALAYLLSPIDLIPDGIPVLGQLDDLVIVPALLKAALLFVPPAVVKEAREKGASAG